VLTAWNGLMITAFAQAAQILAGPAYAENAVQAADFVLTRMRGPDGRLLRTWSAGSEPKLNAYLDDYAFLLEALVSLYEATFAPRWIKAAIEVAEVMIEQFWDPAESGFYYTGKDHEPLIARTKDIQDSSTPSGNALAVTALLRLAKLTGRIDLQQKAEGTLKAFRGLMERAPMAAAQMLIAFDFHIGPVDEFAVVGDPAGTDTQRVLRAIQAHFRPNKVVALKDRSEMSDQDQALLPLLKGKTAGSGVATYLCRDFACQAPLVGVEAAEAALK
jgi:uncharacterized protein YyaL (SSP411 family)